MSRIAGMADANPAGTERIAGSGAEVHGDVQAGTLVAAVYPGLLDTAASRPWFADMSEAQTPTQAAVAPLRLALDPLVGPRFYGQLVRFEEVILWR